MMVTYLLVTPPRARPRSNTSYLQEGRSHDATRSYRPSRHHHQDAIVSKTSKRHLGTSDGARNSLDPLPRAQQHATTEQAVIEATTQSAGRPRLHLTTERLHQSLKGCLSPRPSRLVSQKPETTSVSMAGLPSDHQGLESTIKA
jgi:hypothetical protein